LLCTCHTVLVDENKSDQPQDGQAVVGAAEGKEKENLYDDGDLPTISYKAQSPDEACLVTLAAETGFVFRGRSHNPNTEMNEIVMDILGESITYTLLNVLEFDSDRKRMSIICQASSEQGGDVMLFCKGADSVIFERLRPGQQDLLSKTTRHLEDFAQEGKQTTL
jgi:phospholipid-translocating ATPase